MPIENLKIAVNDALFFDMVFVEGGKYMMGDDDSQHEDEKPAHPVVVSSFYLGKYLVTQQLWQAVMGENPSSFRGENRPVESVSWLNAQDFIKKLNKETGRDFRLPTEAEWEFAARGGIYSQGYDYCGSDKLKQVGWYNENSSRETHDVGQLLANELGLYDMSGNVYEWCEDWYDEKYYEKCQKEGTVKNPVGPDKGVSRVLRGGSWIDDADNCRPAYRDGDTPDGRSINVGFRLCLSLQSVG